MSIRSILSALGVGLLVGFIALALAACSSNSPNPGVADSGGSSSQGDSSSGKAPTIQMNGSTNYLALQSCNVNAVSQELAAGSYTIKLEASTLSKGNVVSSSSTPVASSDNYVLVYLPLPPGDQDESHRFFMLNGVGNSRNFSLPSTGTVQVMFVDSDQDSNNGQATVSVGGFELTVAAATNVLRWKQGCSSQAADVDLEAGSYQLKLSQSTLSSVSGSHDDYLIIRTPSEDPTDDHRYVVLNGVGGTASVSFTTAGTLHAWALGLQSAPAGKAVVEIAKR